MPSHWIRCKKVQFTATSRKHIAKLGNKTYIKSARVMQLRMISTHLKENKSSQTQMVSHLIRFQQNPFFAMPSKHAVNFFWKKLF